jgi:glycine betaine/choline ABC-type transport system substrate-binding protein
VSERLTTAELRKLNAEVANGADDLGAVARAWLEGQGLL